MSADTSGRSIDWHPVMSGAYQSFISQYIDQHSPFGQHQETQPLAWFDTGSPQFTDFPSPCACSESSLINLIGWEYEMNSLHMFWTLDLPRSCNSWCWPKRSAASGEEHDWPSVGRVLVWYWLSIGRYVGRYVCRSIWLYNLVDTWPMPYWYLTNSLPMPYGYSVDTH